MPDTSNHTDDDEAVRRALVIGTGTAEPYTAAELERLRPIWEQFNGGQSQMATDRMRDHLGH